MTATLTRPVASTLRVGRSRGPLTLAGVAFLLYSAFSWLQWSSYISPSYDLGIFSQIADRYAHFEAPVVTILGEDFNALGDHFHPLLILLGPVYALFPTPFSLLVVQNLLFAVSVYVVTRFAMGELGRTSGLLLGGAYALSWGLQSAVEAQFHAISLAVPLLALAIVALLSRRWWWAAVLVMPLVFVKEDLGLTVALFGLILAVQWRSWWGLGVLVWGAGWFLLTVLVLIPALNPEGDWSQGSKLGLSGLFNDPGTFFQLPKLMTIALLLLVTLGIGLTSPVYLLVLPTLAWRFLGDNPYFWGHFWQYSAVLMPIVFLAAVDTLAKRRGGESEPLTSVLEDRGASREVVVLPGARSGSSGAPAPRSSRTRVHWSGAERVQMGLCAGMLLVAIGVTLQMPLGKLLFPGDHFRADARASAEAALSKITVGSVVETDHILMNYLVSRHRVYHIGTKDNPVPDYFVLALYDPDAEPRTAELQAEAWHAGHDYRTIHTDTYFQVARRVD